MNNKVEYTHIKCCKLKVSVAIRKTYHCNMKNSINVNQSSKSIRVNAKNKSCPENMHKFYQKQYMTIFIERGDNISHKCSIRKFYLNHFITTF